MGGREGEGEGKGKGGKKRRAREREHARHVLRVCVSVSSGER